MNESAQAIDDKENQERDFSGVKTLPITPEVIPKIAEIFDQVFPKVGEGSTVEDRKDHIYDDLSLPGGQEFSFYVPDMETGEPVAFCLAYRDQSDLIDGQEREILNVDSIGVLPGARGSFMGLKIFYEVLQRASSNQLKNIEILAREKTTGKAIGKGYSTKILKKFGYHLTNYGLISLEGLDMDTDEKVYLLGLDKIDTR